IPRARPGAGPIPTGEAMEYRDKSLVCVECHQPFIWTAGEQLFYADKNFKTEPKRCKECKSKRNSRMSHPQRERVETTATCSQCGKETTVPFKPTQGRPVEWQEGVELRLPLFIYSSTDSFFDPHPTLPT